MDTRALGTRRFSAGGRHAERGTGGRQELVRHHVRVLELRAPRWVQHRRVLRQWVLRQRLPRRRLLRTWVRLRRRLLPPILLLRPELLRAGNLLRAAVLCPRLPELRLLPPGLSFPPPP